MPSKESDSKMFWVKTKCILSVDKKTKREGVSMCSMYVDRKQKEYVNA